MFNRSQLKARAKSVLAVHYWPVFLIIFLAGVIESVSGFIMSPTTAITSNVAGFALLIPTLLYLIMTTILSVAVSTFVLSPVTVGVKRFLLNTARQNSAQISDLIYGFKNGYMTIATASLIKTLILLACPLICTVIFIVTAVAYSTIPLFAVSATLLLILSIIPMFIKYYDYYLTDYILADNPNMPWRDVLKASKAIMKGNRFKTFVLNLSFLGWILLGILACGIGVMFVDPYIQATDAQLYLTLAQKDASADSSAVEL